MSSPPRKRRFGLLVVLLVLAAGGVAVFLATRSKGGPVVAATWTVRRQDLRISVTEGGSVQALKANVITSEVEGETKILSIVPEGMFLTPEDVAAGRVIVELDSSALKEKKVTQEITVSEAASNVEQARQSYALQEEGVRLATRRVESASFFLQAGRAETRDVLEAESALIEAKNALTAALVDYVAALLALRRDTGELVVP